jgi:hypothetical protein
MADEGGVSFWLPGLFGSLAAAPLQPGWSLTAFNYYTSVSGSGAVGAAREITAGKLATANLNVNLTADANLVAFTPTYVFATPVLGGQLSLGMLGIVGVNNVGLNGTLQASFDGFTATRQGSVSDSTTGFGDLYPQAMLRWNNGVNNYMVYATGDIPVGTYSSSQIANIGIGHGAIDGGFGYTYFNPGTGHEFSFVTGATYNFTNLSTNYQNGIDWHLDWGASQFLSKQLLVGAVGYFYGQLSPDRGSAPILGTVESQVIGIGPQIGYIIPTGSVQTFIGLKGYGEFDGHDRPSGWNAWLTVSFSPLAASPSTAAARPMVTKASLMQ